MFVDSLTELCSLSSVEESINNFEDIVQSLLNTSVFPVFVL
jgi:hypothetical protein